VSSWLTYQIRTSREPSSTFRTIEARNPMIGAKAIAAGQWHHTWKVEIPTKETAIERRRHQW
jgi:predicted secreted Zn-dependent protease